MQASQRVGDLDVVDHAPSDKPDFPSARRGNINHLLDAWNRTGEAGNQYLARRRAAQFFDPAPNLPFRRRVSGPFDIGAVAEQGQHPFLAVPCKGVQIKRQAVDRRGIHLEVAGVDDHTQRRAHRQRHAIDRAVRDVDVFHFKGANLRPAPPARSRANLRCRAGHARPAACAPALA